MSGFMGVFRKKIIYNTSICLVERRKRNTTEVARGILENVGLCSLHWQLDHQNSKHMLDFKEKLRASADR